MAGGRTNAVAIRTHAQQDQIKASLPRAVSSAILTAKRTQAVRSSGSHNVQKRRFVRLVVAVVVCNGVSLLHVITLDTC
uniref:Uncharacterized protein n=1 Tax=Hyaloperonospora arabidopsidis (strain Emoy2) TaxID=559515 RepID=M4B781_HYAAE